MTHYWYSDGWGSGRFYQIYNENIDNKKQERKTFIGSGAWQKELQLRYRWWLKFKKNKNKIDKIWNIKYETWKIKYKI